MPAQHALKALKAAFPWVQTPLIIGAPMRLISLAPLAAAVSNAGGIGFIGAGDDVSSLTTELSKTRKLLKNGNQKPLPIGVGFIVYGANLEQSLVAIKEFKPAVAWLFAPRLASDLKSWFKGIEAASEGLTKSWVQVGSVAQALESARLAKECGTDISIVVQGSDAGGHGLVKGAGIISLLPETVDTLAAEGFGDIPLLAAGGIVDGRGVAAALALGASGSVIGTRLLAATETTIKKGYQDVVISTTDGGQTTVRTHMYDNLRGTTGWPSIYDGRGIVNASVEDAEKGMPFEENKKLYEEEMKKGDVGWTGDRARMAAYVGSGVGLVKEVIPAGKIVEEVRSKALEIIKGLK
jgi:nitronate monooxygenase